MGSGASTLTDEQKASITKEMKEKYESIDPAEQPNAQENLMKHYEELVKKMQAEKQSTGLQVVAKKKKKRVARMRSFENGNFLLENVAQPKKEKDEEDQDFWDSVSTQPTCLLCKMVFTTETKRTTHMKYSEVHQKNVEALEAEQKRKDSPPEEQEVQATPPEVPSFRCRELYSGSKFYWRLQDTLEYHMYLHLEQDCIEVIPYDHHKQLEYPRLYFAEEKLHSLAGPEKIAARVKSRLEEHESKHPDEEPPKEADLLADERRQSVVSLLLSKLQLSIPNPDTKTKVVAFKMTTDGDTNPLLPAVPDAVTPVLVKRRRLSTTEEIEAALLQANEMEVKVNVKLHEAEELENLAHIAAKV